MKIFVTADQHFGHANIIKHCNRKFASVEEMDAHMIKAWNETVSPGDVVYHLGDFAWKGENATKILSQLNGTKHLIKGNHDSQRDPKGWTTVRQYAEVPLGDGRRWAILSHYRMVDWHGCLRGNVMLHGHSHGTLQSVWRCLDVGVDSVGYAPLELIEAARRAEDGGK